MSFLLDELPFVLVVCISTMLDTSIYHQIVSHVNVVVSNLPVQIIDQVCQGVFSSNTLFKCYMDTEQTSLGFGKCSKQSSDLRSLCGLVSLWSRLFRK